MTLSLLDEGTTTKTSQQIAEEEERLGAEISASGTGRPKHGCHVGAEREPCAVARPMADIVRNPSFAPAEVERVRTQTLTGIAQQLKDPNAMASRALPFLLFGETHPYASTGVGDAQTVGKITRDDLLAFQQTWLRPDDMEIFVVSDRPLSEIQAELDRHFGHWQAPASAKGVKQFTAPPARPTSPRIVLIDRPQSPQSVIVGGQITPVDPRSDVTALQSANDVIGGNFLSRINMDLRETKGWSYGVRGSATVNEKVVPYIVSAPVQADRTGDSIAALATNYREFLTVKGTTQRGADPHRRQQHPAASGTFRNFVGSASGHDHQRSARPSRQLLRDACAALSAPRPRRRWTRRSAGQLPRKASSGWSSAMRRRSARSSRS
jgi:predicted Zn-dependent peptidase